jgi:SHS family lactate transporter-like MFS transporter
VKEISQQPVENAAQDVVSTRERGSFTPAEARNRDLRDSRAALIASFAGWTLDAFDFFLVVFCLTSIGQTFHESDARIALSITATLAFRPVGAIVIGLWADRYGRRLPFIVNVLFYATTEALTGLVHSYGMFIVVRALFGIGMGGQWGVGASLAMEKVPIQRRGVLSGLLQQGYALGSILAAVGYFFVAVRWGWRPLFFVSSVPALLLAFFVYFRVRESQVWKKSKRPAWGDLQRDLRVNWKLLVYMSVFLTMMHFAAHGTQDMYPTFLEREWHLNVVQRSSIVGVSMFGAILGGIMVGYFSDRWGRRRAIIGALSCGILVIPLWAYAHSSTALVLGAFIMQWAVMGAWGVIPAHFAELSPGSVRAFLPGFAYQIGALLSSAVVYLEAVLAQFYTEYANAMALIAVCSLVLASVLAAVGQERRGTLFEGQDGPNFVR